MGSLVLTSCLPDSSTVNLEAVKGGLPPDDWALYTNDIPTPNQRRNGGGATIVSAFYGAVTESSTTDARTITWTNGTPTASGSSTDCVFNTSFASGNGFSITVPADTTPRRLMVFCGPYNTSPDTITASLSDGSAAALNDTTSLTGASGSFNPFVVIIDYSADSAGQTMTVNFFAGLSGPQTVVLQGAAVFTTTAPPTITDQPDSVTVLQGATANFSISATGTGTLHYQWKKNGVNDGTDSSSYSVSNAQPSDNGAVITCDVTDDIGTTNSAQALLTVVPVATVAWLVA